MDPFLAQITLFGGNFAPRNWAFCDGQLLAISSNTALFSILGTIYGGDGRTTFALPDLRGRAAVHKGRGPGLSLYNLGQKGGTEYTIPSQLTMANHTHQNIPVEVTTNVGVSADSATSDEPEGHILAISNEGSPMYTSGSPTAQLGGVNTQVSGGQILPTGGNQQVTNIQPFLGMNYIIALQGVYPSRS